MTRNRQSAKAAGARFERLIADYLADTVDDRIDRRVRNGSSDRGDIGGVRLSPALGAGRVVLEVKNYTRRDRLGSWLTETEVERGNDDATVGVIVSKRHGKGDPADQIVTMTMHDFVALLTGRRPS